jgi:hypothetical protein
MSPSPLEPSSLAARSPSIAPPATPESSPEKLDFGSIDDEDGAYAPLPSLLAAASPEGSVRATSLSPSIV